jgi:protein-tyrosine-phosphatase
MEKRPLRWLIVCSGNICRSPMAAGLADRIALERGVDLEIRSAGTLGFADQPPEPHAIAVCREHGIDITRHRSQALTAELVAWADRILVMDLGHAEAVTALDPDATVRVVPLGPLAGVPAIADPYGSWLPGPYRATRDLLDRALRALFDHV